MNTNLIKTIVQLNRGRLLALCGVLLCLFNDPAAARSAAQQFTASGIEMQACGCEIRITL